MITVHEITGEIGTLGVSIVIDNAEDVEAFKKLIFRGANLWPDAPASIKTFADELEHGKALQDYSKQDTSVKSKPVTNIGFDDYATVEAPIIPHHKCTKHTWKYDILCTKCGKQVAL